MRRLRSGLLLSAVLLGLYVEASAAASKQYVIQETPITFADAAQSPTVTFTLTNLLSGAGQVSARHDRGTAARASRYKWRCWMALTGTNTVGEAVEWYLATSDGTRPDGEVGTAAAALASNKRNNLLLLGLTVVDQTTTNTLMTTSGIVEVVDRYVSFGVWNGTSLPFQTSTSVHGCSLTPSPPEMQ